MALLLGHSAHAQPAAQSLLAHIDSHGPLPTPLVQLRKGAPDSDESVTFEDMLAGACGSINAAAAQMALDVAAAPADFSMASEDAHVQVPASMDAGTSFDTTVGARTAQGSWREPLVDSVFFSDSDGDGDEDGHRSRRKVAGAQLGASDNASLIPQRNCAYHAANVGGAHGHD